jgi:hypothetical protein
MLELYTVMEQEPHSDRCFSRGHDRRELPQNAQKQQHGTYLEVCENILDAG